MAASRVCAADRQGRSNASAQTAADHPRTVRTADVNDGGPCAQVRWDLGVYVLGAIEPAQRARADRHLAACPQCRGELAGLAGLPALLRKVPAGEALQLSVGNAGPAGPPLSTLLGQVARVRRRRRLAAAAAVITATAAASSGLVALHPARPPAAGMLGPWVTAQAANPATRAWAAVRYASEPWGTELEVRVTGVAAGTRCQLWVTGPRGQQAAAGGWIMAAGQRAAWYPASAPFQAASVRAFEITAGQKILVRVAAR
jgi:hypothetical protein